MVNYNTLRNAFLHVKMLAMLKKKQNVIAYHIARCKFLGKGNEAAASEASMNYARKRHEAGSKRVESRVENDTNQARKWYKPGSKMERTRLENGTNQVRTRHKPGSKMAQTRLENGTNQARKKHAPGSKPARKILQIVSFRLEAGHDRRIDVTQMTGNFVRKAFSPNTSFKPSLHMQASLDLQTHRFGLV